MADAKKLIPFILKWEGGFANHPNDKGGATNKGITIATFRHFFGSGATVEQLKAMTDEQWETVFRKGFWNPFKGDEIKNQSIANICVDWAWGSGTTTAIKQVQRLLGVVADGVVGNITLGAINNADPEKLFEKIRSARLAFVEAIVKRDASQQVFLKGWCNRINSIQYTGV
ncbi:MAG: peptidoglycan domain protein [Bacteroidales bacterium]|nr:peptidoglycan domain protein [Bacteroidales bacterium]